MSKQSQAASRRSRRAERRLAAERAAKRRRQLSIFGSLVAVAVVVVVILVAANRPDSSSSLPAVVAGPPLDPNIPVNGRVMGNPDAKVTLVEWADYQCPWCTRFNQTIEPEIIKDYVATGKIKFEYRDYAFIGQDSIRAAQAAMCAADQGKFWEMNGTIFANHTGENVGDYSASRLKEMASLIGLDTEAFNSCLDKNTHKGAVEEMAKEARDSGVTGTPTLFLNGQKLNWDGTYASIQAAIEQALAS